MYRYFSYTTIISLLLFCLTCADPPIEPSTSSTYDIGDTIATEHQQIEFNYCYPICGDSAPDDCVDYTNNTFNLSKESEKIYMIEMSATWWDPCYNDIPVGEQIYEYWKQDSRVEIIHFLFDLAPSTRTCSAWGHYGELFIPPIVGIESSDDLSLFRDLFPVNPLGGSAYPLTIFIDQNMQIINIQFKPSSEEVNFIIQTMLDNME